MKPERKNQNIEPEESAKVETVDEVKDQDSKVITIMTENDSYISERMKGQPKKLSDIVVTTHEDKHGIHRLSLPEELEPFSHDCTMGVSCSHHGWVKEEVHYGLDMKMDRWKQSKHGKYVFRWLNKNKRALDFSINVRGWYLVNRSYFESLPKILFSVNGGIENGDAILGFMPMQKAVEIRNKPSKDSLDRVDSESNKHESNPNFYKAKLDSENADVDYAPADALMEGRDF